MEGTVKRHKAAINKFHKLLRCGKDYSVSYMCDEVAKKVYMQGCTIMKIVNQHYQKTITDDMVEFVNSLDCQRTEELSIFSEKYNLCIRESMLIIRYIRRKKNG